MPCSATRLARRTLRFKFGEERRDGLHSYIIDPIDVRTQSCECNVCNNGMLTAALSLTAEGLRAVVTQAGEGGTEANAIIRLACALPYSRKAPPMRAAHRRPSPRTASPQAAPVHSKARTCEQQTCLGPCLLVWGSRFVWQTCQGSASLGFEACVAYLCRRDAHLGPFDQRRQLRPHGGTPPCGRS